MKKKILNTFGYWDRDVFVNIFFNGNEEIESLWINLTTILLSRKQIPTKVNYEMFIKENTPKYFQPK